MGETNYEEKWIESIDDILKSGTSFADMSRDMLVFETGVFEAVKRYVKACEDYQIKRNMLMALMGIEEDKDE